MKKFLTLISILILLAGCTTKTTYGECIGITDDKQPNLQYKADTGNIILAFIFSETIVVPAVVVFSDLYCPIAEIK